MIINIKLSIILCVLPIPCKYCSILILFQLLLNYDNEDAIMNNGARLTSPVCGIRCTSSDSYDGIYYPHYHKEYEITLIISGIHHLVLSTRIFLQQAAWFYGHLNTYTHHGNAGNILLLPFQNRKFIAWLIFGRWGFFLRCSNKSHILRLMPGS